MKISIIGLGLIGSSIAIDLRKSGFGKIFLGVDANEIHQIEAIELNIVDQIVTLEHAIAVSDLIILATPVNISTQILPKILDKISENSFVTDVGSTKENLIEVIKNHTNRKQFVAAHPMSGTEKSGPNAAFSGLFENKIAIICDAENSNKKALDTVEKMYQSLGSNVIFMTAKAHDEHVGYVSHLSHVIAYALAVAVLEKEKSGEDILKVAAGGFTSTVRLAKSSAEMWTPIFEQNKKNILPIIDIYMEKLAEFRQNLEENNTEKINEFIKEANKIKKIL